MPSIKQKTISGFKWSAFSKYGQKVCTFISFIILARILEPKDFGLFAMAFIVIDGLNLFKNFGVDAALIQRKDHMEEASHTAFWMMPAFGICIFLLLFFFAPAASMLLKEPSLTPIIRALGFIFLISSVQSIPQALLSKEMRFKEIEIRNLISTLAYSICAIILAYLNFGVWSLVYAYLLRRMMTLVLTWMISDYQPKFIFNKKIALELLHFGKFIFGVVIIDFLIMQTDNFFVGRMLGTTVLGFYALAYNISELSSSHLANIIGGVMFPAYVKIQDDKEAIRRISLKIIKTISVFAMPFGITLMLLTEEIITTVYGAKWLAVVPALKILALCSIILPIFGMIGSVFVSCGKPKWAFKLRLLNIILMVICIPVGIHWKGLTGAAIAVTFAKIAPIPVGLFLINKMINLNFKNIFKILIPSIFSSFSIYAVIYISKNFIFHNRIGIVNLGIILTLATLSYFSTFFLLDKKGVYDIKEAIFDR